MTTADEEDDGWARIEEQEDEEAFSRVGDRASKDVGLRALLGVNSVVVRESRSGRTKVLLPSSCVGAVKYERETFLQKQEARWSKLQATVHGVEPRLFPVVN